MSLEFCRQIFEKYLNIKFRENTSSWSSVCQCGRSEGRTDMTKLILAFRNFAKALKISHFIEFLFLLKPTFLLVTSVTLQRLQLFE